MFSKTKSLFLVQLLGFGLRSRRVVSYNRVPASPYRALNAYGLDSPNVGPYALSAWRRS